MISHPKPQTVKILKRKTATEPQTFLKISIIFMPIKNIITFLYRVSFPGRGCPKYIVYCTRSLRSLALRGRGGEGRGNWSEREGGTQSL